MITMYGHVPAWGIPDLSPYVTKIDCYLRMTGLPYELVLGDLQKAPKGKLPYLVDGTTTVADTSFILEYLQSTYGDPLDGWLSPEQRATGFLLWRLMDESFYWMLVQSRYRRDEDFALYDPLWAMFFGGMEEAARLAAITDARQRLMTEFYQSGRGRHTAAEVEHIACREIDAVVTLLGTKRYLFGDRPSTADCAVHAFLQGLVYVPFENAAKAYALAQPRLMAWLDGISDEYYPELRAKQREYTHG
ncbi:MAG: glutathione S-transferase N-terminal domain-containing protein [Gammaproteobacteria bacterium]|nr:glutathione S-transferase N-terminal domain-containing protein [Gammaproteobacteria bacterium]